MLRQNWILIFGLGLSGLLRATAGEPNFARDIRPLLSDRCFACHGPDENHREADLRVDDYQSLIEDRGGYQVVKPGDPEHSELLARVFSDDADLRMPPEEMGKPLSEHEKELLREWIASGAAWAQHWAYEPPRRTETPEVANAERQVNSWVDLYIARGLQDHQTTFAPRADRTTLLRRMALDVTGLPPSLAALDAAQSDAAQSETAQSETPDALDRYLEELLASPAFGERMAVYWLDLVRYADTVGYHGDQDHSISPYRDYVINAFNDNLPFDQFTVEQLAGDLLPEPSQEQRVATGYNRLLQTSHEGGVQPKEYLSIYQADRVRNLSEVWFGATIGCAQCHDHKYDPYTSRDFYALAAFFADVDEEKHFRVGTNALPTKRPPETEVWSRAQRLLRERIEQQIASGLVGETQRQELQAELDRLEAQKRRTMITQAVAPRMVRFLPRGNWLDDSGEVMSPRVPEFLGDVSSKGRASRLDLAHWLVDPQEGVGLLTARVFVNRLWMLFMGQGLSRSVEDFGGQGEAPTHPELLDRLALEFVESGWDIKQMVRLIVGSRTYRQSSLETAWHRDHDPENRLWSRQNRFRLPAEMVRDVSLACADLLVREIGGDSVKPYQPAGFYRHLNFPVRKYQASMGAEQWRRGLYTHWQRQFLHPMLAAFDAPRREECTAKRSQSNTPLAALVWLNDPSFVEAAKHFAAEQLLEAESRGESVENVVRTMFRIATSREPDTTELQNLTQLWQEAEQYFSANLEEAEKLLAVGQLRRAVELEPSRWAAAMMVARAILNLNETYTRN